MSHSPATDLTGRVFGDLSVLGPVNVAGRWMWSCACKCGGAAKVTNHNLLTKGQRGCVDCRAARGRTHGASETKEFRIWAGILTRTTNPRTRYAHRYILRGITVCAGWLRFECFLADMGPRPSPEHSIDRIDNNGGYWCGHCDECRVSARPANCRWATRREQMLNTRINKFLSFNGRSQCVSAWARELEVDPQLIYCRISNGWPDEACLFGKKPGDPTGRVRLSEADVVAIREAVSRGERHRDIAGRYGVCRSFIGAIAQRKARRNVQ